MSPFARRRGEARAGAPRAGVEPCPHPGLTAVDELGALRTQAGKPYTVFSPFHRTWLEAARGATCSAAPRELPALPSALAKGRIPSLESLGLEQEVDEPRPGARPPAASG